MSKNAAHVGVFLFLNRAAGSQARGLPRLERPQEPTRVSSRGLRRGISIVAIGPRPIRAPGPTAPLCSGRGPTGLSRGDGGFVRLGPKLLGTRCFCTLSRGFGSCQIRLSLIKLQVASVRSDHEKGASERSRALWRHALGNPVMHERISLTRATKPLSPHPPLHLSRSSAKGGGKKAS
jgi:hypothetical protein